MVIFNPFAHKHSKFGTEVGVADIITSAKFLAIGWDVDSVGVEMACFRAVRDKAWNAS